MPQPPEPGCLTKKGSSELVAELPGDVGVPKEQSRLIRGRWDVVEVALDGSESGLCAALLLLLLLLYGGYAL